MGEMARVFFIDNPALSGPLIAMFIFAVVFVVAGVRAARADRSHIDRIARFPLEDEDREVERHG